MLIITDSETVGKIFEYAFDPEEIFTYVYASSDCAGIIKQAHTCIISEITRSSTHTKIYTLILTCTQWVFPREIIVRLF